MSGPLNSKGLQRGDLRAGERDNGHPPWEGQWLSGALTPEVSCPSVSHMSPPFHYGSSFFQWHSHQAPFPEESQYELLAHVLFPATQTIVILKLGDPWSFWQ